MLKTIFLAPGRVVCGQSVSAGHRPHRFRRSAFRQRGPVLGVSLLFWALLAGLGVILSAKLGTNVDPPAPPPKAGAQLRPAAQAAQAAPGAPAPAAGPASAAAGVPAGQALLDQAERAALAAQGGQAEPAARPLAKPPEIWLVIVESIPKSARPEAERAVARHRKKGVSLELLDTDAFPRLKSGLWALAQGPFDTKKEADEAAAGIKAKVKSLMVRRGL
jgi:hypothetical protein